MPFYDFINNKTGEIKSLFFHMNDDKKYIDDKGVEWKRVFESPNANISLSINPFSAKDFFNKTSERKGTVGDLWDLSAELSKKREQACDGTDPIKQKAVVDYEKKTRKPHPLKNKKDL